MKGDSDREMIFNPDAFADLFIVQDLRLKICFDEFAHVEAEIVFQWKICRWNNILEQKQITVPVRVSKKILINQQADA